MKVHIASSRLSEIGTKCIAWSIHNLPRGWNYTTDAEDSDVFISVLYDTALTPEFLNKPGRRCYNFHPGILPDYRGSGCYSWALINREPVTGVTLHEIDKDLDHGRIIKIEHTQVLLRDTAEDLFKRSMDLLFRMFQFHFLSLLNTDYITFPNTGGRLYLREHLDKAKDITHIVRAFTFSGKESAYWIDSKGEKRYVEYE